MSMTELVGKIVVIKRNGTDGAHFPMRNRECLFGRHNDCDIRIQLPNVSKEHAKITVDDNKKVWLTNLSTCNDTLLNGDVLEKITRVKHLDVFTIIDRSFRFEYPSTPKKTPTRSPKKSPRRKSGTPLKSCNNTPPPKMPTPKGSPRTPIVNSSLKENIGKLRRNSVALQEVDETLLSPADSKTPLSTNVVQSPSSGKRKSSEQLNSVSKKKRVSFGPMLSPEQFDKELPPQTPVRRGATPRRKSSSGMKSCLPSSGRKRHSIAAIPVTETIEEESELTPMKKSPSSSRKQEMPSPSGRGRSPSSSRKQETPSPRGRGRSPSSSRKQETPSPRGRGRSPSSSRKQETPSPRGRRTPSPKAPSPAQNTPTSIKSEITSPKPKSPKSPSPVTKTPSPKSLLKKIPTPSSKESPVSSHESLPQRSRRSVIRESQKREMSDLVGASQEVKLHLEEDVDVTPVSSKKNQTPKSGKRKTPRKLSTPLRKAIQNASGLRQTKRKLDTPLRNEIAKGVELKSKKKSLSTPVRKEIESKPELKATKKSVATPLRKEIESKPQLKATKKSMATPIRKQIESKPELKATKKSMATPVRKEIESKPQLKATKKSVATPLRKEIESKPQLKATKKSMATPIRKQIESKPQLKATKQSMATPVRKEIESKPQLKATKKSMATPVRKEIESKPQLKATKKRIATPLQREIQSKPRLRKTKKTMPADIQEEIKAGPKLRKTKRQISRDLQEQIIQGKKLRPTKQTMPSPLKEEIKQGVKLKRTMKSLPTPLKDQIKQRKKLKKTKKQMFTPLKKEIIKGVKLHTTKRKMPADLKKGIEDGVTLKNTKKTLKTPLRKQIQAGTKLRQIKPATPATKRRRSAMSDNEEDTVVKKFKTPAKEVKRKALKTPLRQEIKRGFNLRTTRYRMATPLKVQIQGGKTLRVTRRRSTKIEAPPTRKPTYAEIVKRPKLTGVRQLKTRPMFVFGQNSRTNVKAAAVNCSQPQQQVASSKVVDKKTVEKTPSKEEKNQSKHRLSVGKKTPKQTSVKEATPAKQMSSASKKTPGTRRLSAVKMSEDSATGLEEVSTLFATPVPVVKEQQSTGKKSVRSTRKSIGLQGLSRLMKTPKQKASSLEDLQGLSDLFASPVTGDSAIATRANTAKSNENWGNWLKTLAKAAHGTRSKNAQVEDLEGVPKLFTTPPPEDLQGLSDLFASPVGDNTMSTRAKTTKSNANWLKTLARAAHGKRLKNAQVEDLEGVPELFTTPPVTAAFQTRRKSLRKSVELEGVASLMKTPKPLVNAEDNFVSELFQTPHHHTTKQTPNSDPMVSVEPIQLRKTPSLRSARKQSRRSVAEVVNTPIQPSTTPSLRSPSKQVTQEMKQNEFVVSVNSIHPSNTPSLRSARKQSCRSVADIINTPLQPSTTPSLRTPSQQVTQESKNETVVSVEPIHPSITPSLRSARKQSRRSVADINTPLQPSTTPSLRTPSHQVTQELKIEPVVSVEPIHPSITPSLRSARKQSHRSVADIVNTPLQPSTTPSLRTPSHQVTQELKIEPVVSVEPIHPSITPSLRSAGNQSHYSDADIVNTPLQSSRTPSLRTPSNQLIREIKQEDITNDSFKLEMYDSPAEATEAVKPTRTPSLRSPAKQIVQTPPVWKSPRRDSAGLNGISRLMQTPKSKNTAADLADNFEPELFKTPVTTISQVESPTSRTTCSGQAATSSTMATRTDDEVIDKPVRRGTRQTPSGDNSVESSVSQLKVSPKSKTPVKAVKGKLKAAGTRSSRQKAEKEVVSTPNETKDKTRAKAKKTADIFAEVQVEEVEVTAKRSKRGTSASKIQSLIKEVETTTRATRSKRTVPEDTPVTSPKPKRAKRGQSLQDNQQKSHDKTPQKRSRNDTKAGIAVGVFETPKPIEFKRTPLEAIQEVPTPAKTPDVVIMPPLKSTKKTRGSKRALVEPEVTSPPMGRATRYRTTSKSAGIEAEPRKGGRSTRSKKSSAELVEEVLTSVKPEEVESTVKTQRSHKRKAMETPIQEAAPPHKSRRVTKQQPPQSLVKEEKPTPRKTRQTETKQHVPSPVNKPKPTPRKSRCAAAKEPEPSPVKEPEQITRRGRRAATKQPKPSPVKESEPITRKSRRGAVHKPEPTPVKEPEPSPVKESESITRKTRRGAVHKPEATPVKEPETSPVKEPEPNTRKTRRGAVHKPEATPVKEPETSPVKEPEPNTRKTRRGAVHKPEATPVEEPEPSPVKEPEPNTRKTRRGAVHKPEATPVKEPEPSPVKESEPITRKTRRGAVHKPEATPVKEPETSPVKEPEPNTRKTRRGAVHKPEATPVEEPEPSPVKEPEPNTRKTRRGAVHKPEATPVKEPEPSPVKEPEPVTRKTRRGASNKPKPSPVKELEPITRKTRRGASNKPKPSPVKEPKATPCKGRRVATKKAEPIHKTEPTSPKTRLARSKKSNSSPVQEALPTPRKTRQSPVKQPKATKEVSTSRKTRSKTVQADKPLPRRSSRRV